MKSSLPKLFCLAVLAATPVAIADNEVFAVQEIPYSGRVVTASFADFNGDGADDLMLVTLDGIPPAESRTIHVHYQSEGGVFPEEPSRSIAVPLRAAVYDIADVLAAAGEELVLLRPDAVSVISVATDQLEHWPVPPPTTVGPAEDERGFERYRMAFDEFGEQPWILVPQIGALTALVDGGETLATLDVGRRANYYIDSGGGLLSIESDMQLYFDSPKISVGDINGDGVDDIIVGAERVERPHRVVGRGPEQQRVTRDDDLRGVIEITPGNLSHELVWPRRNRIAIRDVLPDLFQRKRQLLRRCRRTRAAAWLL